jgi:hypothetical protein
MQFDLNRLRFGEIVAAAGGILLFVVMYFRWYNFGIPGGTITGPEGRFQVDIPPTSLGGVNAWQAFSWIDIFLFITVLAAVGLALLTALQRSPALPVAASVLTTILGLIAVGLILYRIIDQPGPNEGASTEFGAYLGLISAAIVAIGGWAAMREEGTSWRASRSQTTSQNDSAGVRQANVGDRGSSNLRQSTH